MSDQPNNLTNSSDAYGDLLDHEYDGIHEYDNPTPGWWHLIFIGCVLFAIPYSIFFHWSPMGWSIYDQYEAEVAAHTQRMYGDLGVLTPDDNTIASLMGNEKFMAAMKSTYATKCVSCHGSQGQGGVGPNLTDEVYKNVKSLSDIYQVIDKGVVQAGMPAWGRQLSDIEMILMSAYVGSLRGQNITGSRPPEGEPIAPWPVVEPMKIKDASADSTEAAS